MKLYGIKFIHVFMLFFAIELLNMFAAVETHAQLEIKKLSTPDGVLMVRALKGTDCDRCEGLFLNGRQVLHDANVSIERVYPSQDDVKLVLISSSNGGNCCPPMLYILDVSVKPHVIVKDIGFGDDIARSEQGVVFTTSAEQNELGS